MGGLLVFAIIFWLVYRSLRKSATPPQSTELNRFQIADKIQEFAQTDEYNYERATYFEIARSLRLGFKPRPTRDANGKLIELEQAKVEKGEVATVAAVTTEKAVQSAELKKAGFNLNLDNINLLLFLGAFLIVISTLILVNANAETFSDGLKLGLMFIFTLAFYGYGLYLYRQKLKLRPAAIAFTAIGMILVPICGIAFYRLAAGDSDPVYTWFGTSALATIVYFWTAKYVKSVVMPFIIIAALLSTLHSFVALFDLRFAFHGLVLVIEALVLELYAIRQQSQDESSATRIIAQIIAPIGAIFAFGGEVGGSPAWVLGGVGLTLLGLFYFIESQTRKMPSTQQALYFLALMIWPFAALSLAEGAEIDYEYFGLITGGFAIGYVFALEEFKDKLQLVHLKQSQVFVSIALAIISIVISASYSNYLPWMVLAMTISFAYGYWRHREISLMASSVVLSLLLPLLFGSEVLELRGTDMSIFLSLGYSALASAYLITRLQVKDKTGDWLGWLRVGYGGSLAVAWLAAQTYYGWYSFSASLILLVVLIWLSFVEDNKELNAFSVLIAYLAEFNFLVNIEIDDPLTPTLLIGGAVAYGIGLAITSRGRDSQIWRYGGLAGLYLGIFGATTAVAIGSLFVAGLATLVEAFVQKNYNLRYFAAAVMLLALEWALHYNGVRELLVFSGIATVYFATVAYLEAKRGNQEISQQATIAALAVLTLPLLLQVLNQDNQARGILLMVINALLVVLGLSISRKLVYQWGASLLIFMALYQTRDAIAALPKQLFTFALGIGLLGLAIYHLNKNDKGG